MLKFNFYKVTCFNQINTRVYKPCTYSTQKFYHTYLIVTLMLKKDIPN